MNDIKAVGGNRISKITYKNRVENGLSEKDALEKKPVLRDCFKIGYDNIDELLETYHLKYSFYQKKIIEGKTLKDILDESCVVDHLGNYFKSYNEMARYYSIPAQTLINRLKKGYTIEESIKGCTKDGIPLTHKRGGTDEEIEFRGKVYFSKTEIARDYSINVSTFLQKLREGMSLDEAVDSGKIIRDRKKNKIDNTKDDVETTKDDIKEDVSKTNEIKEEKSEIEKELKSDNTETKSEVSKDNETKKKKGKNDIIEQDKEETVSNKKECTVNGRTFKSLKELALFYGVKHSTIYSRLKRGYTIEQAISKDIKKGKNVKYNGMEFNSILDLCNYYDLSYQTFYSRYTKGFTIEECIKGAKTKVKDHEGNEFSSVRKMCEKWGVTLSTYYERKKLGYTLKGCLVMDCKEVQDEEGNKFDTLQDMLDYYNTDISSYKLALRKGMTIQESLYDKKELKKTVKNVFKKRVVHDTKDGEEKSYKDYTVSDFVEEFGKQKVKELVLSYIEKYLS